MTTHDNVTYLPVAAPSGSLSQRCREMAEQFVDADDPLEADLGHVLRTMADDLMFLRELLRELLSTGNPSVMQRRWAADLLRALDQ